MNRCRLFVLLAAFIVLGIAWSETESAGGSGKAKGTGKSHNVTDKDRQQFLDGINAARKKEGIPELKLNAQLDKSAQDWAGKIHKDHKLKHGGMNGVRGQCIAEGQRTPADAVKAWLGDGPHRAILLGKQYREAGFGQAGGYWVADFK